MRKETQVRRGERSGGNVPFHVYIARQIELSEKTQREIAEAMGYSRPNLITMFKQGSTKVPIEKVPLLAKALGLDPARVLTLAMQEYMPEVLRTIQETFGHTVTDAEFEIVETVREATNGDVKPPDRHLKIQLRQLFR